MSERLLQAEHVFASLALLWPFALTVCMTALRWKGLRSKAGFLVLGVLGCFGLQAFLARLARYLFWTYLAPREPSSYSTALRFIDPIAIIAASVVVSVPLLIWLAALLAARPASDDP